MSRNFSRVFSAQPWNLSGHIVSVEVDITRGLHAFSIVGLPDKAVEEARDRVSSAIKHSDFPSPKTENHKIVVSLAPADLKKEGSYFDTAIAVGYLLANHLLNSQAEEKIEKSLFLGELTLNGESRSIHGTLPLVQIAKREGFESIFVPFENKEEAAFVEGITIYPYKTLAELVEHLEGKKLIEPQEKTVVDFSLGRAQVVSFSSIRGQEEAKRALEIAAAGGHNVLLSGPPGTGKTMLARAFQGILPELSRDASLEITGIHSIAGTLIGPLVTHAPFRSPHHTASYVSIIGGGSTPKPGEVTLAHRGILFMDEFPEFDKKVLESLRQPLEDRFVSIARARGTAQFPAHFVLVAAMNPCPCGNRGAKHKVCRCTQGDLARYARKLSGPIMDRIDIHTIAEHVEYDKLSEDNPNNEDSDMIRARVANARALQRKRFQSDTKTNAAMSAEDIQHETIADNVKKLLNESAEKLKLSPRAYHRTIKLARTIADLSESIVIEEPHILEALQYRPKISF